MISNFVVGWGPHVLGGIILWVFFFLEDGGAFRQIIYKPSQDL